MPEPGAEMKIHKKVLNHYLSCTSPVDKEGYLYKMKERTATYHRRWFVLKGNVLFYQERPADRHLLGVIVLEGCVVRRGEADGQLCFSLVFQAPGLRAYRFAAEERLTQESWVKVLLSASHCNLSLLVRDLGHQYEEAKREAASVASGSTVKGDSSQQPSVARVRHHSLLTIEGAKCDVRDGRSYSTGHLLQEPSFSPKAANKKSPKHWSKRNAHVTPLNGPAPLYGEWPSVGLDPLEEFSKLHEYYGEEVLQVRGAWLRRRQVDKEQREAALIDI
ncbi:sesquipedalian-1 [Gadus morhua]|uniref:sesquipedalian-1 n=1 Tax=Gadus morhua TaxID=8049 RepID=UPI0011B562F9|nr:sesquipedalian-1-like [Gadus morhua]XP_030204758.1 sesquipedalian-1-like [Gadus morhua]